LVSKQQGLPVRKGQSAGEVAGRKKHPVGGFEGVFQGEVRGGKEEAWEKKKKKPNGLRRANASIGEGLSYRYVAGSEIRENTTEKKKKKEREYVGFCFFFWVIGFGASAWQKGSLLLAY